MADIVKFNFGALKGWTPYSKDGGRDRLPEDGFYYVTATSFQYGRSKPKPDGTGNNPMVTFYGTVSEGDPKTEGLRVVREVLYDGVDKKGNSLARQFGQMLFAFGMSAEVLQQNAEQGVVVGVEEICNSLIGKGVVVDMEADEYEGNETSKVRDFVDPEVYMKLKSIGKTKRPRKSLDASVGGGLPAELAAQAKAFNLGGGQPPAGLNGPSNTPVAPLPPGLGQGGGATLV